MLTRRDFLTHASALAAVSIAGWRSVSQHRRKQTAPNQTVGITLSHFEYDFDILNDSGKLERNRVYGAVQESGHNQSFIGLLSRFSVLRFLNWQKTNLTWMQPPPPDLATFQARETRSDWRVPPLHAGIEPISIDWGKYEGVPLAVCLNVAQQTGTRPWLCLPHGKSAADFTALMQTIVAQAETAEQTPIYEFSNELWNGSFGQQKACAQTELGRAPANGSEQLQAALTTQRKRTNEIAEAVQDRGQIVVSGQCYNPYIAQTLLDGGLSVHVDAVAIAPYFGIVRDVRYTRADLLPNGFHPLRNWQNGKPFDLTAPYRIIESQLTANLLAYLNRETKWAIQEHRRIIDQYNRTHANQLQLWAYESGPDLHWRDNAPGNEGFDKEHVRELYLRFNRSDNMGHLVSKLRQLWFAEAGDGILNGYSSATAYKDIGRKSGQLNYDTFGLIELSPLDENNQRAYHATPKYDALIGDLTTRSFDL